MKSILLILLISVTAHADFGFGVSDDLSPFAKNAGTYSVQGAGPQGICNYAYKTVDLSVDVAGKSLTLKSSGSGEGSLDTSETIAVSLNNTYSIPCTMCSVSEGRVVVSGKSVINQTRHYDIFANPFSPAIWRDADPIVQMPDSNSLIISFETLPCRYVKN